MSFQVVRPRFGLCVKLFQTPGIFQLLQQKYVIQTSLYIVQLLLHLVCIRVECLPNTHGQEMKLVRRDQRFFSNVFHMGAICCLFPAILRSSIHIH